MRLLLALAPLLVPVAGCVETVSSVQSPEAMTHGALLVGTLEIQSDNVLTRSNGCTIEVGPKENALDQIGFHFDQARDFVVLDLAPGTYEFRAVQCEGQRRVIIKNQRTAFTDLTVKAGRNNYFGHFILKVKGSGGSTNVDIRRGVPPLVASRRMLDGLRKVSDKPLISPYTDKEVTTAMLELGADQWSAVVKFKPNTARDGAVVQKIDACMEQEKTTDPLRFHGLHFEVAYVGGKMTKISETKSLHAYSDRLVQCVKGELAAWQAPVKNVEVKVEL